MSTPSETSRPAPLAPTLILTAQDRRLTAPDIDLSAYVGGALGAWSRLVVRKAAPGEV